VNGETLWPNIPETVADSPSATTAFLRTRWILGAVMALERARKQANLSQEELAQKLGTTQSAISRTETDDLGRISLRRYVDWMIACGVMPAEITTYRLSDVWIANTARDRNTDTANHGDTLSGYQQHRGIAGAETPRTGLLNQGVTLRTSISIPVTANEISNVLHVDRILTGYMNSEGTSALPAGPAMHISSSPTATDSAMTLGKDQGAA